MAIDNVNIAMPYSGERMVPEAADSDTYWEHLLRYAFASKRVIGLDVLDIASGEGYGTYALSKVAKQVIGVDISNEAIEHARSKYGLDFRVGSADCIPVGSASQDAIISFETIEHLPDPSSLVREAFRILRPGAWLIISTPNKEVYRLGQPPNPFHCSELTKSEFETLLLPFFEIYRVFGQTFQQVPLDNFERIVMKFSCRLGHYLRRVIENELRKRLLPAATADISERRIAIESIPTLSPPLSQLWNRHAIRPMTSTSNNRPMYFIALAKRRISKL